MNPWLVAARKLAKRNLYGRINGKARAFLEGLVEGKPILIACSGGADSVFLTFLLFAGLKNSAQRLHLAHFNHGLRGDESDLDADFVSEIATGLGIPFHLGEAKESLDPDEASLRTARYEWLTSVYQQFAAGALCLGQQADDVLESVLMGALGGAGPAGLASPMPVRTFPDGQVRVRPLLPFRRATIEELLLQAGATWRRDVSNQDSQYTRNRLRLEIIPRLAKAMPQDIISGALRTRQLMEDSLQALDEELLQLNLDMGNPSILFIRNLRGRPQALIRRALYQWWTRHQRDRLLPRPVADPLIEAIQQGAGRLSLTVGGYPRFLLDIEGETLLLRAAEEKTQSSSWAGGARWFWCAGVLFLPKNSHLSGERISVEDLRFAGYRTADPDHEAWLQTDAEILEVRCWEPGDRYQPLGAPGRRKLQDLFGDSKLSLEQKRRRPVILNEAGEILWVPGFPPSESWKITPDGKSALKLTYHHQSTAFA